MLQREPQIVEAAVRDHGELVQSSSTLAQPLLALERICRERGWIHREQSLALSLHKSRTLLGI